MRMFNLKKKTKMKRNLIERVGLDRIAHFGVGGVIFAAFIKEYFLDSRWDWWDFIATMAGPVFIHLCAILGFALHFGNGKDLITTPLGWVIFSVIVIALAALFVWWVIRFNKRK